MAVFKFHVCLKLFNACQFVFLYLCLVHRCENLVFRIFLILKMGFTEKSLANSRSRLIRPTAVRKMSPHKGRVLEETLKKKSSCSVYRANSKLWPLFCGLRYVFLVVEILDILHAVYGNTIIAQRFRCFVLCSIDLTGFQNFHAMRCHDSKVVTCAIA